MSASITMPIEQYESMKKLQADAEARIKDLDEQLVRAKLTTDSSGCVEALNNGMIAALEIVGFAMANLSPEIIKRWPHQALSTLANNIPAMPTCTAIDIELQSEIRKFVIECQAWEVKRKTEGERYVPPPSGVGHSLG